MKKTLTILSVTLIIILFSFTVKAQDAYEQPKSYLTFLGGVSLPLGDFKSSDYYNNKAGFGKVGPTFGFDGAIFVYKNWSVLIPSSIKIQQLLPPLIVMKALILWPALNIPLHVANF
jgi:hypothetical protein